MANKQSRINQLIFGDTGVTTDFGQIGSESAGSPVTTKNLDTVQALSQYAGGLASIVDSGLQLPRLEDQNSLFLLITTQLRYLLQNGVAEWKDTAQYFALVSFVQVNGVMYQALTGTDGTPNVNHNPVGDATNWQYADAQWREMGFRLNYLGLPAFVPTDLYTGIKLDIAMRHGAGDIVESAINAAAVAWSAAQSSANPAYPEYNPIIPLWDGDHDLPLANHPILVPKLRAQKMEAWSGSAYVTDHTVTVAGSVATGSGTAWDNQLAALAEDELVSGSFTNWRCGTVAGVDIAIASISTAGHSITFGSAPTTGTQTLIFYSRRIPGSTAARVFKDSGRVTMSPDGQLRIAGTRRRFHMQGHWHTMWWDNVTADTGNGSGRYFASTISSTYKDSVGLSLFQMGSLGIIQSPVSDGPNGTPITGPETEPNSSTVYRAMWAQTLL